MVTVKCQVCGKEFESPSGKAMYCSQTCRETAFLKKRGCTMSEYRRSIYKKKIHDPIPCPVCGKMFVPARADIKYCSRACRFHRDNILARVRKNNELAKHTDCYGRLQTQCEVCHKWFTPKEKGDTICTSCKIFLKYAKEHPDMI